MMSGNRYFASPWVESCLKHLPKPPCSVLDIGCGRGRHSLLLLDLGYDVTAVDRDASALAVLEQRVPQAAKGRLTVVCQDLEADATPTNHATASRWPPQLAGNRFAAVLVVNYLHRPMLARLLDLIEPSGILVFEAWAKGNEDFAAPKSAQVLMDRSLRPNELLEVTLLSCEVLAYSHGPLEEYEGRDCVKQMICARLIQCSTGSAPVQSSIGVAGVPESPTISLASLLSGAQPDVSSSFLGEQAFGKHWVHAERSAPDLDFGVCELLALLRDYDPQPVREAQLAEMRRRATAGAEVPLNGTCDATSSNNLSTPLKLWGASMVRRLPKGEKDSLVTDTINDDKKIRYFLDSANLVNEKDLVDRGDNWTFVVNQLQGVSCVTHLDSSTS